MVPFGTTAVSTGSAQRAVAYTNLAQVTNIVKINLPAYRGGAVFSAVHISDGGPFYIAGSTSPFLAYVTAAGAPTSISSSVPSSEAIVHNSSREYVWHSKIAPHPAPLPYVSS